MPDDEQQLELGTIMPSDATKGNRHYSNGSTAVDNNHNFQNGKSLASAKKFPQGFMKEDNGNYSSMRLMSFLALIIAIIFASITLHKDSKNSVGTDLTYTFLVAAFAPKAVQKFAEKSES